MGRIQFAPQVSGSGEGAMPPAGSRPLLPDSGSGNRTRELGSDGVAVSVDESTESVRRISDPRSASVSSRRRLTNPKG